ncbi:hypothetical protein AB4K20DRAFT_1958731 [Rhizopus microsporus]
MKKLLCKSVSKSKEAGPEKHQREKRNILLTGKLSPCSKCTAVVKKCPVTFVLATIVTSSQVAEIEDDIKGLRFTKEGYEERLFESILANIADSNRPRCSRLEVLPHSLLC